MNSALRNHCCIKQPGIPNWKRNEHVTIAKATELNELSLKIPKMSVCLGDEKPSRHYVLLSQFGNSSPATERNKVVVLARREFPVRLAPLFSRIVYTCLLLLRRKRADVEIALLLLKTVCRDYA